MEFFIDTSFWLHYGPGIDTASNRNEYQEYFLGGKGSRCVGLTTLPPSCRNVLKSGSLKLLEPSGPVHACNGIALHLLYIYIYVCMYVKTLGWDSVAYIVNCNGLDSPGIKSWWGMTLIPPQFSAKFKERVELYLYSPLGLHGLF